MKYLIVTINSFQLALDIKKVFEIIIPGVDGNTAPEKMLGDKSMIYQDKNIPILFAADSLFNIPSDKPENFRIILCEINNTQFGLLVDNANEIVSISKEDICSVKKYPREIETDILDGKFNDDDNEIYILAPDKILTAVKTV